MIGTNDIDLNIDVASAPARLGALIDRITLAAPEALLVVASILPTTNADTNERIVAYDAAIPGLIESRRAAGKHVASVDMYAAFTANPNYASAYLVDALHPNVTGYALLGQTWYAAILPYLPPAR
jgi:lysophospholipase L1-like esterase